MAEFGDTPEDTEAIRRESRWKQTCPPLYREIEILESMRRIVPASIRERVFQWRWVGTRTGLLLHGETGGFKTTLMFALARRLIVEEGRKCVLMRGDELGKDAAAAYGQPQQTDTWLARFKGAEVLLVDELFKGDIKPAATSALFSILEYRTSHLLPTIATSNATGPTVRARVGDPATAESIDAILDRVRRYFDCIHIPGPDRGVQ